MRKAGWLSIVGALAFGVPAAAESLDWESPKDRELIDGAMRQFASQCGKLGFTPVATIDPKAMQSRLYSRSLLVPEYQSQADLERWSSWIGAMTALGDTKNGVMAESIDRGGAALTAAVVDPSSHDAAKARFISVSLAPLRNFKLACETAAADDFVSANYVAGEGSLDSFEVQFAEVFERTVAELKAEEAAR